jgi:hypothetical protein
MDIELVQLTGKIGGLAIPRQMLQSILRVRRRIATAVHTANSMSLTIDDESVDTCFRCMIFAG